jgi:phosphatidylserine/phosphatidylglycerophosphate/cardiolipin synthase-like enzyme
MQPSPNKRYMNFIFYIFCTNVKLLAVKKLHTKLYIFDNNKMILGLSNFTTGGLETNIELNIFIENENGKFYFHDSSIKNYDDFC